MAGDTPNRNESLGELACGYIDGELTQQQRQRVELLCETSEACRQELEQLRQLREDIGRSRLSEYGEDKWRETMNDPATRTFRGLGWILLIAGLLAIGGIVLHGFLTDPTLELHMKLIIGAIYGGLAILFISVLRQRLIERKSDKYKDVEI